VRGSEMREKEGETGIRMMEILLKRTSVWLHHCLHKYEVHIFVIVIYHRLNLKLFFKINFLNDSKKKKKKREKVFPLPGWFLPVGTPAS
jgi:hypothetical protein